MKALQLKRLQMFFAIIGAWLAGSGNAVREGDDRREALVRAHVTQATAAKAMGITPPELNEMLKGVKPLNAFRWAELEARFPAVKVHLVNIQADRLGLFVVERPEVARLFRFLRHRMATMRQEPIQLKVSA